MQLIKICMLYTLVIFSRYQIFGEIQIKKILCDNDI